MKESEFKKRWEEWYGDMLSFYQWQELEYKGRRVLYVCGRYSLSDEGSKYASTFTQVMGYADSDQSLNEAERKEIREMLCRQQGVDTISFWNEHTPT